MPRASTAARAGLRRERVLAPAPPGQARRPRRPARRVEPASPRPRGAGPPPRPAARCAAKNALARSVRVDLGLPRPVRRRVGIQPVAELRRRDQQPIVAAARHQGLDPGSHAVPLVCDHPASPYDSYTAHGTIVAASAQPARPNRDRPAEHHVRDDARHAQHRVLLEREVPEPAPPERLGVEAASSRRRERLRVAGPAEPLVALRAVGGHGDEVVALRPGDVLVQPVERRVASTRTSSAPGASLLIATSSRVEELGRPSRPRRSGTRGT